MSYHILRMPRRPQYGAIEDDAIGIEEDWLVGHGDSCAEAIQGTPIFSITKRHKGMKLDDFIPNLGDWLLVTGRVKDLFAAECKNVETYRIELRDQKAKPVKDPYFLVQVVGTVRCVDRTKSEFDPMPGKPDRIHTFQKLVLEEKQIPKDLKLFRIAEQPETILIRSDLVGKLKQMKAGGFELWELGDSIML